MKRVKLTSDAWTPRQEEVVDGVCRGVLAEALPDPKGPLFGEWSTPRAPRGPER